MVRDRDDGVRLDAAAGSDDAQPLMYLADGSRMILPDSVSLLHADFARRGSDLMVGGADRPALVILDYFASDQAPDLMTEGGAVLPGHVIRKLAGADLQGSSHSAKASGQEPIGHVEQVEGEVIITRADGTRVVAAEGTPLYQDDVITTDGGGAVGLRFVDGMTLSLGSDARMILDEFVYNPEAGEGGGIIEVIQGAFSFISGEAAHIGLDSLVIETPTMTIGIRGTKVVAQAAAEGETTQVVLLPEDDGTIGKIMISTDAGQELLEQAFVSTTVTSRFLAPASQTFVTPDWVYSHFSKPLAFLPTPTHDPLLRDGHLDRLELPDDDAQADLDTGLHHEMSRRDWRSTTEESSEREAVASPADATLAHPTVTASQGAAPNAFSAKGPIALELGIAPENEPAPVTPAPGQANAAPVVVTPIVDANLAEDATFSYDVAANFSDDDSIHGDTLTFSATQSGGAPLPAWLSIDPSTGVMSGTPLNVDVGGLTLDVRATDSTGANVTSSFQLTITNSNDAPVVVTPIVDANTAEDAVFSYDVAANFADDDNIHGDSLTFSATQSGGAPLPAWLSIDPSTGVMSGTPLNADVGGLTLDVRATDSTGANVTSSFQLTITNSNDAPVVVTPIADASPLQDLLFSYDVSSNFADDDTLHGDTLTFSAEQSGGTPLPAWLAIDPATGMLSGTPGAGEVGITYTLEVTATDGIGAGVLSSFQLVVDNVNDAPVVNILANPVLTAIPVSTTDPAGDTIADIIVDGSIIDPDGGTVEAIAVTGVDDANGTWEYSINAGANWTAVGAVSDNGALLLDATAMLRFIPDPGYDGSATFTFRAWDQTAGGNGQTGVDVSINGGTTPFSLLADIGSVSVQSATLNTNSGSEFQISTETVDKQQEPSVAALADGGFVVTWQSLDQDGDNWGVYGQRYDSAGSPAGAEFLINTATADEQKKPSVAALLDGGFVVAWQSKDQDGDNWGVYGQRYDSAGSPAGAEFQINSAIADEQKEPSVAALADGGFVVTWESKDQDGDNSGVYGQRYDSTGSPTGAEFQINTTSALEQKKPSVAALPDGGFMVAWQSKDQDGDNWGVYGQRYDSAGSPTGAEFQINSAIIGEQKEPSVAALEDGGFVVVWQSKDQDGSDWGVYGQRYDSAGNPDEFEFRVNTETFAEQQDPSVSALADGGFIVTWQSKSQDGSNWGVYGQRFNADGDTLGPEFQINTTSVTEQKGATTAALSDGSLVVGWQSKNQDGDDWGIFGHRYENETATVTVNPPEAGAANMLSFAGTNSYVDMGDPGAQADALDIGTSDVTVEAWFYYTGPSAGNRTIVSKGNATDGDVGFNIFIDNDELVVRLGDSAEAAGSSITMPGTPGWHHVAMVIDQEAGADGSTIKGYLDGSDLGWTSGHGAVPDSAFSTSTGVDTDDRFLVGGVDSGGTVTGFFDAEIADARVWSTARTAVEIQTDMSRTLNGDEPHLRANWNLDDGVGPLASDAAASGYDGTLTGGPSWQDATNLTTALNTALAGRLSASDLEGDTLTYGVATNATNGTASIDAQNGTWTYDPDPAFSGSDGFSYQVSDGNGGIDTVTIAVTVTP